MALEKGRESDNRAHAAGLVSSMIVKRDGPWSDVVSEPY